MIDIELDKNDHDLSITTSGISIVDEASQIEQRIKQALQFIQGEWFLDTDAGISYYSDIWIKNPDIDIIDAIIKDAILGVSGVTELIKYESEYSSANRTFRVTFTVNSTYGEIAIEQAV